MHKSLLLFLAVTTAGILFFPSVSKSQNTSPFWSLAGNSNATASSKLGTTNSIPLRFFTNNAERMRIDAANGRLGIGTTTPQQRLHVEGSTLLNIFVSTSPLGTTSGAGMIGYTKFLPTAAGHRLGYFLLGSRGGAENNYNAAGMLGYASGGWTAGSSHPAYLTFETTPSGSASRQERMRIDANGNVGIGVQTPGSKLHVEGKGLFNSLAVYDNTYSSPYGFDVNEDGKVTINMFNGGTGLEVSGQVNITGYEGVGDAMNVSGPVTTIGYEGRPALRATGGDYAIIARGEGVDFSYGVYSSAGPGTDKTYGVYGQADAGADSSFGVYGTASGGTAFGVYGRNTSSAGYGVYGSGFEGVFGKTVSASGDAVRGEATGSGAFGVYGISASSYGVAGVSTSSYGVYGRTSNSSSYAGYFAGNVFSTGTYTSSDGSLKKDITEVPNATAIIRKLKPRSYNFKQEGDYSLMNLPTGKHYGLIAQDVEQVLPELVKTTTFETGKATLSADAKMDDKQSGMPSASQSVSFKAINYTELIPILIKGMQEYEQLIATQEQQIANLNTQAELQQKQINELKQMLQQLAKGSNHITSSGTASISQSTPNPAQGIARIAYSVPSGARNARLLLTDNLGRTIRTVQLTGSGTVDIETSSLSNGVYNYSLVIDSKTITTHKMTVVR